MLCYPRTLNMLHILLITINIKQPISQSIDCNNAFQCVGQSLNTNSWPGSSRGYTLSFDPSTDITAGWNVYCNGAFSCDSVASLSSIAVYCYGSNSCSNIKNIDVYGNAYCRGANACELSGFTTADSVYCYGEKSCANSLFIGVSTIVGLGAYSLYNATIYSTNNLFVKLYGEQSGFSAKLFCQNDHFCNINCAGNGCEMMYIECNGNCIINKESTHSIAPITDIKLFNINLLNSYYYNNLRSIKSINTFDNDYERSIGEDIVIYNDGSICCRGSHSCYNIKQIQSSNNTNNSIICSGSGSCREVTQIINNGHIICSGWYSCTYSDISTFNNIYCHGSHSCSSSSISAKNIYCSGRGSCREAVISSNGDINIYFTGYESAIWSEIYCNTGDECRIFCVDNALCSLIRMLQCDGVCYKNDAVTPIIFTCNVYNPCLNVTLSVLNEHTVHIHCIGTGSCLHLFINARNVVKFDFFCQGYGSCLDIGFNIESVDAFELLCNSPVVADDVNKAVCELIVVDVGNSQYIDIWCIGDYGCNELDVNVENVDKFSFICEGHAACSDLQFDIESMDSFDLLCKQSDIEYDMDIFVCQSIVVDLVKSNVSAISYNIRETNISCIGRYGCNKLYIDTGKSENVNINGDGYKALNNLSVYGKNSNKINIKCWSDYFNGKTCENLKFYLSIKENSNTLQCRFGCNKIEFYFKNDINLKLLNNIQFYECSLCIHIKYCIEQWIIHYNNYNSSIIYNGYNISKILEPFSNYIDKRYQCPISTYSQIKEFSTPLILILILTPILIVIPCQVASKH